MKKNFTLILISTLVVCGSLAAMTNEGAVSADTKGLKANWVYSEQVDEMTDAITYFAEIEANEELDFSFPYNGGTTVWLILRKRSSGTSVILSIPKAKGQFIPNVMGDRSVLVRFDDKPAEKYTYSNTSDYSPETIFIMNAEKFIKNLKASQSTIVRCEFFNEGTRTIKFDTGGLEWNH